MPLQGTFHRVLDVEVAVALAVFLIVNAVFAFALVRRRASRNRPSGPDKHPMVEGACAVLLVGIASTLTWLSISANHDEHDPPRPQLVVDVTGFQWCWRFSYPDAGFAVTATCGPGGRIPTLVLPVGEAVQLNVTSSDVVHEFWVPALDYKTEAMPDHVNSFTFTPTSTGRYVGRCSEFCGEYHAWMDFVVQVVGRSSFTAFVHQHAPVR